MKNLLLIGGLLAISSAASAVNLVSNGSFETYDKTVANGSGSNYWTYNAGNAGIAGWTVGMTSVDTVTIPYMVQDGASALDLAGTPGPGSVSQSLATANGASYLVSFYGLASGVSGTNADVKLSFGGASQTFNMGTAYTQYSFTASAASASTLLSLATAPSNTTNGNLLIDNVSVQAVPEPTSFAALGVGALGLLRRRTKRA